MWQDSLTEQQIHLMDSATNKWELIQNLSKALCEREKLDRESRAEIEHELIEREKLMSTGIGEQMAIPHAVVQRAPKFMTECAIVRNGLDFESIDGSPAYIVVLLVAPKSALQEHLKVMASIAKVFYNADTRQRVIAATSAAEVLNAIRSAAG